MAHVFKLAGLLRVEDFAVWGKDREGRDALVNRDAVLGGHIEVGILVADRVVDEDEVLFQADSALGGWWK